MVDPVGEGTNERASNKHFCCNTHIMYIPSATEHTNIIIIYILCIIVSI
jgi:hypothetical protein